ncbi:MBL fold metallo-hydrolase [Kordiimonas sp. SCSIO 12603]|uniref:MBL fold metallo-hydrolase n=1 Tax=Kordiimonas sp. SCSIO 12603 TaxID=2829596 RepID=UPI002107EE92|nr:MBL fold metallo-hydrolase [Kordiimonas sp. SCSIO 12603]UTW57698.1 MBL fold metallo-hydrolase [Kordiimonas sp. SCSIO 12603]
MKKLALLLAALGITHTVQAEDITVCHIANAGFYVESGGIGVLIDAVMQRDAYNGQFALPSASTLKDITEGNNRFSNVKLAVATHIHADHFDAAASVQHMKQNPMVRYLLTPKSFDALSPAGAGEEISHAAAVRHATDTPVTIKQNGLTVEVYQVDHGERAPTNFGYKITFPSGKSVFHTGDITASLESLKKHGLDKTEVDVLLIPFWYLLQNSANVPEAWNAGTIVPTHFMTKEQEWMAQYGGMEGVKKLAQNAFPEKSTLIDQEMQCKSF